MKEDFSPPPSPIKPFCLPIPIRDTLHHRSHLPVNVCQVTGLPLLSPCSQLPTSTHSCGNNVAEQLKTTLKTTSLNTPDRDISLSAANLRNCSPAGMTKNPIRVWLNALPDASSLFHTI